MERGNGQKKRWLSACAKIAARMASGMRTQRLTISLASTLFVITNYGLMGETLTDQLIITSFAGRHGAMRWDTPGSIDGCKDGLHRCLP